MTTLNDCGVCPECGANWNNGDILERFKEMRAAGEAFWKDKTDEELVTQASYYGWTPEQPKCFSRLIGVELPYDHPRHYDGVSYWECPDCHHQWPRFLTTT